MTWKQAFTSSVGRKIIMSLTGIFLILFLIVHVSLNACIWANDNGEMFNKAAYFMGQTVVMRVLEYGLFLFFIIHILQGLYLTAYDNTKRGIPYAKNYGNRGSKWYSRSMGLLGTLILLFLILHLANFWVHTRFTGGLAEVYYDDKSYEDLYGLMKVTFSDLTIVILYVLGCISLAYHLAHGFQSAFRTLGVHHKKYLVPIVVIGNVFAIVVPFVFAMMPISMYFGWI